MSNYKILDQGPIAKNVDGETKRAYKYRIQTDKGVLIFFNNNEMEPDEIEEYVRRALRDKN